jgi:hypothetical protein
MSLWQDIKNEIRVQLNEFRSFIALAGTETDGRWTIQRVTEASAGSEQFARMAGFDIAEGDEVICTIVGGKPLILGKLQRSALTEHLFQVGKLRLGSAGPYIQVGTGSPDGVVTAGVGSLYIQTDGYARHILWEKQSGSGNTGWGYALQESYPIPGPMIGMVADTGVTSSLSSNSSYAVYFGRAESGFGTINVRFQVNTAGVTITWAEVGIGTSPQIGLGDGATITRRGFTNVASVVNSTGEKTVAISTTGISPGDHLWGLIGAQASTMPQYEAALGGTLSAGYFQSVAARISTMSVPQAFGAMSNPSGFAMHWAPG